MDTSVVPDAVSFEVKLNGVVRAVDLRSWESSNVLLLTTVGGIAAADPVTVELLVEDINLHRCGGANVLPFGPETLVEVP